MQGSLIGGLGIAGGLVLGILISVNLQDQAAGFDTANLNDFVSTVPVLGIYAGNSPMTNRDNLKKVFPNSEYVQVAGTGHFVMLERPEEFNRLLLAFLGKVKY